MFIGLQAPYKPVSSSTISRWIKLTLGESGVNTDTYKSHSTRSASTSAAAKSLDISVIMKAANWSRASTFKKFYFKDIENEGGHDDTAFGRTILGTI